MAGFQMRDWWVWSSADLVNWSLESVVTPQASLPWDTSVRPVLQARESAQLQNTLGPIL